MTDNTTTQDKGLWLPRETWTVIASFLDHDDLVIFEWLCKLTQSVSIAAMQPLYNRLYAIDKTLPTLLPQEGAPFAFKKAFEKVQAKQQSEIIYLTQHHLARMAKPEYGQVFQERTTASLQSLEARNVALDKINIEIIKTRIHVNNSHLYLDRLGITRLCVALFQEEEYIHFWQNLTHLNCIDNKITELNLQEMPNIQQLWCNNNQLTTLKVQGQALWFLNCQYNKLTTLNVQGLSALQELFCQLNPLMDLNLTGVHPDVKNKYAELERKLLFKQLSQADSAEARQVIIDRLGANYTHEKCMHYCPDYAETVFASDSANNALSQTPAFLPSFEAANTAPEKACLKRKHDEEEPANQPDLKKIKRS